MKNGCGTPNCLSRTLAQIESRGYSYSLNYSGGEYFVLIGKREHGCLINETFKADAPEEAAGQALLWALEQEGKA